MTPLRFARRWIARRGRREFRRLLEDLAVGTPHTEIASRYGVSHQAVTRWRAMLGRTRRIFVAHPAALAALDPLVSEETDATEGRR